MMRFTIIFIMLICLWANPLLASSLNQQQIDQLKLGMSSAQVELFLGAPHTKINRGATSRWNYELPNGALFAVWFGADGLQNAYGGDFETMHLVKPPADFVPVENYDPKRDVNKQLTIVEHDPSLDSQEQNIFKPILPTLDAKQALESWRAALNSKNSAAYVAKYVPNYSAKQGQSHRDWRRQRTSQIKRAKYLRVEFKNITSNMLDDANISFEFEQLLKSAGRTTKSRKKVDMQYINGKWLIKKESTLHGADSKGSTAADSK